MTRLNRHLHRLSCAAAIISTFWTVGLTAKQAAAQIRPSLTVMLPMSDGVELATDVYLPEQGKPPWPTRLIRTPYGRVRYNNEYGTQAKQGYAMVVQDMRGRWDSQGRDLAFIGCGWQRHQDGVDTCKWILDQSWSDGKIGTEGASAMGITQYLMAPAQPPGVVAQYVLVAAPSLYHHASYISGALRASLVVSWLTDAGFDTDNLWLTGLHPFYDEHWEAFNSLARTEDIHLPAVHFGGWYDVFLQGNIDAFVARQTQGGTGARGTQKLIIGPWGHGANHGRPIGELKYPDNTRDWEGGGQAWFDYYLKGIDTGIEDVPTVQYYTMGAVGESGAPGNVWNTADNWPVDHTPTALYLHRKGRAPATTGHQASFHAPEASVSKVEYVYDPLKPVPTRGGCLLQSWHDYTTDQDVTSGPYDQREIEARDDVIVFTSDVLDAPMEITGRVKAKLWITSDCVDTDFAVKVTDVYPDGRSINVVDGIARCRYRQGYDRLTLLEPGKPTLIEVDLWSTSTIFNKGHRIRVAVTSSNYPKFDVNVNTGWPGWPMGPARIAHNAVLCSQQYASHVVLPVVKR
jgi:hypothetical protein